MRRLTPFSRPNRDAPREAPESGVMRCTPRPRLRTLLRGTAAIGLFAAMIVGYAERTRLFDGLVTASVDAGLRLETIEVRGRSHTPKPVIIAASELTLGEPMLTISLPALHERLSTIGWIRTVAVERRMPSTIRVEITERVPMALLQTEDGHRVIDETGTVIAGADLRLRPPHRCRRRQRGRNAAPILNILRTEPELSPRSGPSPSSRSAAGTCIFAAVSASGFRKPTRAPPGRSSPSSTTASRSPIATLPSSTCGSPTR